MNSLVRDLSGRTCAVAALALFALLAGGCSTTPAPRASTGASEFVLVRHAEKRLDQADDPDLTDAGRLRAQRLAGALHDEPLVAVYSTGFRRTRQTAAPTAATHDLPVIVYNASRPANRFAAALKRNHPSGTVLVVGHSNTVPAIASALCGCDVAPMSDQEYDRRLRVRIADDGSATLSVTRDR